MRQRALVILHLLVIAFCFGISDCYSQDKYRIGAILPLSGDAAGLGRYVKNGIDLAYASLAKEDKDRIEIIFEDDKLLNVKSVSAFQKLTSVDKVDAVFAVGSGVGNALAPLAEKMSKLAIFIGASDSTVPKNKKYVFTHWIGPDTEAKLLVKEIERRGYKKIAFIASEFDGAVAIEQAFLSELESSGISSKLAYHDRYLIDSKDFRSFIAKIRAKQIDAVGAVLYPGALAAFAKQLHELAPAIQLFGFETFEDSAEVKASDGTLVGKWYANADDPAAEFRKSYMAAFHEEPGWAAANSYDTLKLVVEGVRKFGANNLKIAEFLSTLKDYQGAAGQYSASGDNRFNLPAAIKIVTKDGFEKIALN